MRIRHRELLILAIGAFVAVKLVEVLMPLAVIAGLVWLGIKLVERVVVGARKHS